MVAVPFAFKSVSADTAAYAHSGPGSGATGWVDDGSVVRLSSAGDRVGIGTSTPSENLVVGGDLGSFPEANYVVSGNPNFEEYSGFKLGYNADNHATINWYGDGDQLSFHTRSMGTSYNNTLVLRNGFVGINNDYTQEPRLSAPISGHIMVILSRWHELAAGDIPVSCAVRIRKIMVLCFGIITAII